MCANLMSIKNVNPEATNFCWMHLKIKGQPAEAFGKSCGATITDYFRTILFENINLPAINQMLLV